MTYNEFIESIIITRGQWNIEENEYWEGHHILPKCLGGTGNSRKKDKNIIWLYPKEHYEAHKLLALENPTNSKLVYAWHMLCFKKNIGRTYNISAEDSAQAKKLCNNLKSKAIICIETQEIFTSISTAALKFPTERSNIIQALSGKRNRAAGYHWAYIDDVATQNRYSTFIGQERKIKKIKIICIETQELFDSVIEASKAKNIGRPNISYCLKDTGSTAGGYHWAYVNNIKQQEALSCFIGKNAYDWKKDMLKKFGHEIICVELDKQFKSAKAAARYINELKNLKLSSANIMNCCKGKRKTTGGYHWKFINKELCVND